MSTRDTPTRTGGPPAALARHAHDPRRGLDQRVVAGLLAQRAMSAERADRAVDETGVPRPQSGGGEARALVGPRPQALEEDVGPAGEPQHDLAPPLVSKVDRERALARV